ncbi:MAG TPA: hypothetical protein VN376_07325 [Longilinea sp.]|nr:hypothetical protein [Longilinea sp.]
MKRFYIIILAILLAGCSGFPYINIVVEPTTDPNSGLPTQNITVDPISLETQPALVCPTVDCSVCQTPQKTESPVETETPQVTETVTATSTTGPSSTPGPSETPTITSTPTVTSTPWPYSLQLGTPALATNFNHTDLGCNWFGVAGQVITAAGDPVTNLVISIRGILNGATVNAVGLTGFPGASAYGPGGFEIQLGASPVESNNTLTIQVLDLQANPLTAAIPFSTSSSCEQNLVVINFTASH